MPANVVRPERNKRQHLSHVLSRNEVERDYAYNRALFVRVAQGWYQFNPKLLVRRADDADAWTPLYQALNLPFIGEVAHDFVWNRVDDYLTLAGLPTRPIPIAAERAIARQQVAAREQQKHENEQREKLARWHAEQQATREREEAAQPKWGTPEAKRREIERLRKAIADRNKAE